MDVSQLMSGSASSSAVQGMSGGHHHHHHKSVSDQVSQMSSAISNAVQAGTLTSDQAASLNKELADITQTLSQASTSATSIASGTSTTSASSTSSQSNPLSQLSEADRKKVFSELQDVRKQLFAANAQAASSTGATSSTNSVSQLFSQIDTNGNGSIDQAEFTQFLAQIGANALGYNQQGNASAAMMSSSFSVMA